MMIITITGRYVKIQYGKDTFVHALNTISYIIDENITSISLFRNNEAIGTSPISKTTVNGEQLTVDNLDEALKLLFKSDNGGGVSLPIEIADVNGLNTQLNNKVDKEVGKGLSQENFTTAEKEKLAGLDDNHFKGEHPSLAALELAYPAANAGDYAYVDGGVGVDVIKYIWDTSDSKWVISASGGGSETPASIKTKYESNPDTNAFTDDDKSKLDSLSDGSKYLIKNSTDNQEDVDVVVDTFNLNSKNDDSNTNAQLTLNSYEFDVRTNSEYGSSELTMHQELMYIHSGGIDSYVDVELDEYGMKVNTGGNAKFLYDGNEVATVDKVANVLLKDDQGVIQGHATINLNTLSILTKWDQDSEKESSIYMGNGAYHLQLVNNDTLTHTELMMSGDDIYFNNQNNGKFQYNGKDIVTEDKLSGSLNSKADLIDGLVPSSQLPPYPTKDSLGLPNVDNTSDLNKPVSTAQQTAIKKAVDDMQVGGRNYALDSKEIIKNSSSSNVYNLYLLPLSESIQPNTEYILSMGKSEILSGAVVDKYSVRIYSPSTKDIADRFEVAVSDNRQTVSFTTGNLLYDDYSIIMYTGIAGESQDRSMKWTEVKLEKGNKATDWSPAPEDFNVLSNNILDFNPSLWEQGSIVAGVVGQPDVLTDSAIRLRSKKYIRVNPSVKFMLNTLTGVVNKIVIREYDNSKNFLQEAVTWSNKNTFTTTANTRYLRCLLNNNETAITPDDLDLNIIQLKEVFF